MPHINITYEKFGEIHNEIVAEFYRTRGLRSVSIESHSLSESIDKFIETSLPVMQQYFDLDTVSTSIAELRSYLNREMEIVAEIQHNYGLDSLEVYLQQALDRYGLTEVPLVAFSPDGGLRSSLSYRINTDNDKRTQYARLYQATLSHSHDFWNQGLRRGGPSAGTKAIVADAAFGVLAWSLGPWSIVAAGFASAMVNEGESGEEQRKQRQKQSSSNQSEDLVAVPHLDSLTLSSSNLWNP